MKSKFFFGLMLATLLVAGSALNAFAGSFQGTVSSVTNQNSTSFIHFTQTGNTTCYLVVPSAIENMYMAILLTAASSAKQVIVDSTDLVACTGDAWGTMVGINLLN